MKVTIDMSVKDRLEAFLEWLKKRAKDKAHENNGDVIADFVEKILVVELKKLDSKPEVFAQDIEIPDEVLAEPLLKMKESLDGAFNDFLSGKGITPQSGSTAPPPQPAPHTQQPTGSTTPVTGTATQRNGNGHASGKKRQLNDPEKDNIKAEFMAINGEFEDAKKSCTALLPQMGTDITVWQVTGFVSYLHREIAANKLQVPDMDAYMRFLENHRRLWAQYNSQKYQNLRAQQGVNTTPKLRKKTFPQRTV
jgi:hypothetical protein